MLRKGIIKRGNRIQRQHHEPHVIPICVTFTCHGHMCLTTSCSTFNHLHLVDAIRGSHIRCSKNTEQVRERADELIQSESIPMFQRLKQVRCGISGDLRRRGHACISECA